MKSQGDSSLPTIGHEAIIQEVIKQLNTEYWNKFDRNILGVIIASVENSKTHLSVRVLQIAYHVARKQSF